MFSPFARIAGLAAVLAVAAQGFSQQTLDQMPRNDRYERLRRQISTSIAGGSIAPEWDSDGSSISYMRDGKSYRMDISSLKEEAITGFTGGQNSPRRRQRGSPDRGRQFDNATSPDGKLKAVSKDRNVQIETIGSNAAPVPVTTDGDATRRLKYGIACWVYGEELNVRDAMWWSPDSKKLAFYRFDETDVRDYYLGYNQTSIQDALNEEAYPKAGAPNPKVSLLIYDVATKKTTEVETRFGDASLAEYIYDVRWSPDGKLLLFNRTNRKQNHMQFCAADPDTGSSHSVVDEIQPQSWAENHPDVEFLKDNHRFIWSSERNGFKNLYLYNLDGALLSTITKNQVDAIKAIQVDEDKSVVYYTSYGPNNPYHRQLHRASLDGATDQLLTDPALDHTISLAPDGKHFVDTRASTDHPSESALMDSSGKQLAVISKADTKAFDSLGLKKTEVFTFKSADGLTLLYGTIQFPSDFDPAKKYPVLLTVYGGPESGGISGGFSTPNPITELGFLVVNIAGRGTQGRGKAFRDAVYEKLGIVEIDDQAAGVASLATRRYVDINRVGVFGTSYGGYSTIMCMLRHPEIFKVGCASSPVTDWKNYDSIYTERYNGIPDETDNQKGYQAGSAMSYVRNLKGWLMLYFGTADNNVHPSNTLQLVQALEEAGKRYDMQVGPDKTHTQMNATRMWEYFVQHLILEQPSGDPLKTVFLKRKNQLAAYRNSK